MLLLECVCTVCVQSPKGAVSPLELELELAVSHHGKPALLTPPALMSGFLSVVGVCGTSVASGKPIAYSHYEEEREGGGSDIIKFIRSY